MKNKLSTQPYKGTRDFYPEEMAVQRYIFDTWSKTAELFGYSRYDASILEPSELYKSKGAENEELVNEQTYTFIDRGNREVTLRPEMTPTTARMIAEKSRELSAPIRWYSIPNLFRYERPQRGRLREHWQFNCDLFGIDDVSADIEIINLAYRTLMSFGATSDMFEIRINHRALMDEWYVLMGVTDAEARQKITKLNDRKNKISSSEYKAELRSILPEPFDVIALQEGLEDGEVATLHEENPIRKIVGGLAQLGITNVVFDRTIARGFNYYTGTVFEVFDTSSKNHRALLGGGRYDNLTELFGGKAITGIGFGMGDVTVLDFLETHKLLPDTAHLTAPTLTIIPTDISKNVDAEKVAQEFRAVGVRTSVDLSDRKIGKKISTASGAGVRYVLTIGANEIKSGTYTLKELKTKSETSGTLRELTQSLS